MFVMKKRDIAKKGRETRGEVCSPPPLILPPQGGGEWRCTAQGGEEWRWTAQGGEEKGKRMARFIFFSYVFTRCIGSVYLTFGKVNCKFLLLNKE